MICILKAAFKVCDALLHLPEGLTMPLILFPAAGTTGDPGERDPIPDRTGFLDVECFATTAQELRGAELHMIAEG